MTLKDKQKTDKEGEQKQMKRRDFIKGSLIMGAAMKGSAAAGADSFSGRENSWKDPGPIREQTVGGKQPHIIFIMSDQHRGDALHCMGNDAVISPHIDQLAKEGTVFVNGYSSTPSSTPARSGLLTGLSPWHHGMLGYGRVARKYRYEMPRMLDELGYYTFGIGKMHWYPQKSLHGFRATLVDESGRVETPDFVSDYREWFQLQAPDKDPDLTGIGWNEHRAGVYKLDEHLHPTFWTGQTACELIRNYESDKPLFLKISFARPHSPYDPPRRYLDLYRDKEIPAPVVGDWCGEYAERKDPGEVAKDAAFANLGEEYAKNSRRHYYANITFIDDQIGEIVRVLKEKNMYDNALICYTSDHGDMLGDHHHWRKTYAYEGSSHIPYIVKWPSGVSERIDRSKKRVGQPVELRDFLPTFLDVAGGEIPEDMDGKSLLRLVSREGCAWREFIDLEHATCYSPDNYWSALTDGKIKYIWFFRTGKEQLFDLSVDPGETKNLSESAAYGEILTKMRRRMVDHLRERGEGFVKDDKLVIRNETLLYSPNYPTISF